MIFPSISNTINKCVLKNIYFANTDKSCRKKAKACEKTFTSFLPRLKKFVDYKTTNECQLCSFS